VLILTTMESAQARKAKLKAIRDAAGEKGEGPESSATHQEPALKFRNYSVRDQKIEHTVVAPALPPEYKAPEPEAATKKRPQDMLANVAPKKPNWDLRRDVEKQLAKLERRTQRALVQIQQKQALEAQ